MEHLVTHLNLSTPIITDNGALIVDSKTNNILWEVMLERTEALQILDLATIKQNHRAYISTDMGIFEYAKEIPGSAKIRKITIHNISMDQANQLTKEIEQIFKNLSIVKAVSGEDGHLVDLYFSHAQATKQHAVIKFAKLVGITPSEIIGIGDGYNDFSLLMACGLKVAMGNAVEEVKAIADYIAPSVDDDGIADVIEKFIIE